MQNKQTLSKPLVVMLLAGLCCLLWGSAIPFINLGYRYFGVSAGDTATQILFGGCRFFLAGFLTILFESVARKSPAFPKRTSWGNVVKLSLAQTIIQYVFFYIGVAHTASAKGAIIQGLQAFTSILIACFIFRTERMNALKWIGGLIGVAGVVVVNWTKDGFGGGVRLIGEGFVIISMVASACSTGLIKKFGQFDSPVVMSGWQFMLGGAVMMIIGLLSGGRLRASNMLAYAVLFYLAMLSAVACGRLVSDNPMAYVVLLYLALLSAVAYSLWAVLLRVNPVSRVAVYTFLQPIFGVILSLLLVDRNSDAPLLRYAAALAMICVSIAVVNRGQRQEEAKISGSASSKKA